MLIHVEGDRSYAGVPPAAIAFANASQIHFRLLRRPGIGPDRNLHAKAALTQADAVDRLRMQIIRDKFVVALEIVIGNIEKNRSILALSAFFENSDGKLMTPEERRKQRRDERRLQDFAQRLGGQQRNQVGDKAVIGR